jgi:hypothetical protein
MTAIACRPRDLSVHIHVKMEPGSVVGSGRGQGGGERRAGSGSGGAPAGPAARSTAAGAGRPPNGTAAEARGHGAPQAAHAALDEALSRFLDALDAAGGDWSSASDGDASMLVDCAKRSAVAAADALPPDDGSSSGGGWRPPPALAERLWRRAFDGPCDAAQAATYVLGHLCERGGLMRQLLTRPAADGLAAALLAADGAAAAPEVEVLRSAVGPAGALMAGLAGSCQGVRGVFWLLNLHTVFCTLFLDKRPEEDASLAARRGALRARALAVPGVPAAAVRAAAWQERVSAKTADLDLAAGSAAVRATPLTARTREFDDTATMLELLPPAVAAPLLPAAAGIAAARLAHILAAEAAAAAAAATGGTTAATAAVAAAAVHLDASPRARRRQRRRRCCRLRWQASGTPTAATRP